MSEIIGFCAIHWEHIPDKHGCVYCQLAAMTKERDELEADCKEIMADYQSLGKERDELQYLLESGEAAAEQIMQNEESAQKRVKELELYIKEMHDLDYPTRRELTALVKLKNLQIALDQDRLEENNSYKLAVDSAMVCWDMCITGDARQDLHDLISMEVSVALDPKVSGAADKLCDEIRQQTATRCAEIVKSNSVLRGSLWEALSAIRKEFGLGEKP